MERTIEERLTRIEAALNLEAASTFFNITPQRIKKLRDATGWSLSGARMELIRNYGEFPPEIEEVPD